MNNFLRFCSIVSIIIATIKLALIENLAPGTVIFIIICGLIILLGNKTIYIIGATVAALVLFLKVYGGNVQGESSLLNSVLILSLVCLGIYLMLRSLLPSLRKRR